MTLTKEVKDLYLENYRTLKKETEEDTIKWKHIPSSWVGKLTSSKCPYYRKQSIDSMQYLLKYQLVYFTDLKQYSKSLYGIEKDPK